MQVSWLQATKGVAVSYTLVKNAAGMSCATQESHGLQHQALTTLNLNDNHSLGAFRAELGGILS